jgi:hypothetical protein
MAEEQQNLQVDLKKFRLSKKKSFRWEGLFLLKENNYFPFLAGFAGVAGIAATISI